MTNSTKTSVLQSVQKGLQILHLFTEERPIWGVTEITNTLNMNKSTVSRLIGDLVSEGFLYKDRNKYGLGFSLLNLSGVITSHLEIFRESKDTLYEVVESMNETGHIAVLEGSSITYVQKIECKNPVELLSYVGKTNPVSCTSSGKVLLAFQEEERINCIINLGLPKMGPKSITDPNLFKNQLELVKMQGYSVCIDELHENVVSIAAPIKDYTGNVVAAISIVGTKQRITNEKINYFTETIIRAGKNISLKLGFIPSTL